MIKISPALRISFGMVLITISILLVSNMFGLLPDQSVLEMSARKIVVESLAVQSTLAAQENKYHALQENLESIVLMQPDVLSFGMRSLNGEYLVQTSDHKHQWVPQPEITSSATHWQVPIYQKNRHVATLEISFVPLKKNVVFFNYQLGPFVMLIGFVAISCLVTFSLFMRRILVQLDPSKVMPARVTYALNILIEGVLLVDNDGRIVLANKSFSKKIGCSAESLIGLEASDLKWIDPQTETPATIFPWLEAISRKEIRSGIALSLTTKEQGERIFRAKGAPIFDNKGLTRGAIATFDDITEQEKQKNEMARMFAELKMSQEKIKSQNDKLEILATRDSLTGCLNRRAFFEKADTLFAEAIMQGGNIACVMADIDLFKSINDQYGHGVGDEAIRSFVDSIMSEIEDSERNLVGRYGGEEFCLFLADCDMKQAAAMAERIRGRCQADGIKALANVPGIHISGSFGVSDLTKGAQGVYQLVEQSDTALYRAKEEGRNRVICWLENVEKKGGKA